MPYDLLSGVKVVELSMYAFAPSAGAALADWGADVIKVVHPTIADPMRGASIAGLPKKDVGVAFSWEQLNRGKRCVTVDVSTEPGHEIMRRLLKGADVFIINLLPAARARFKLDVEDVQAICPNIVYARASAHGDKGPERERGGFDHTDFWARTGFAHAAGMAVGDFVPQPGPAMGDAISGAFLAGGIAAALYKRQQSGKGAVVDVSLLSSGLWAFGKSIVASQLYDVPTVPRFPHLEQPNPLVAAYTTRDGRQIYLAGVQTDKYFEEFATLIGCPALAADERFRTGSARLKNARACIEALDEAFAQHDLATWKDRLASCPTPWSIVQTAAEAAHDPQVEANGWLVEINKESLRYSLVASPVQFDGVPTNLECAPEHGEHTEMVLMDLGYSWDDISELKRLGAIC